MQVLGPGSQKVNVDHYDVWLGELPLWLPNRDAEKMLLAACTKFGKVVQVRAQGDRPTEGDSCLAYVVVEGKQAADAIAAAAQAGALKVSGHTVSLVLNSGRFGGTAPVRDGGAGAAAFQRP
jgi:hypothetical protein